MTTSPALRRLAVLAALFLPALWTALVVTYVGGLGGTPPTWRIVASGLAVTAIMYSAVKHHRGWLVGVALTLVATATWAFQTPQKQRQWSEVAAKTPYATRNGDLVTIHNVRNFRYASNTEWTPAWYDQTYNLKELEQSSLVLTRFGGIDGLAHVMVAFQFKGDKNIVLSAEIRREEGEGYDPIGGALRQFELYYVAADERDAIALRTHIHKDETLLIPMNAGQQKTAEFFMSMVDRMTKLHHEPEWYNSFTSSCASNLAAHYEHVNNVSFPPDYRILLPGFSDTLLQELDLLPEGVSPQQATQKFKINQLVENLPVDEQFSKRIRAHH